VIAATTGARRLLVVTYHFPPSAEVGGLRVQKFVKHLPALGWHPQVLTIDERDCDALDYSRLRDVASATIERTRVLHDPATVFVRVRRRLARRRVTSDADRARPGAVSDERGRLRRTVIELSRVPDPQVGWLPLALARVLRIRRRGRIDAVLTSGPPQTCHLVGLVLKELTGVPWLADFRDPWVGNPRGGEEIAVSRRINATLERWVIRAADRVVSTNDVHRAELAARYPGLGKFVTISNGFDADDCAKVPDPELPARFTIVHLGTIYGRRSARSSVQALAELITDGTIPSSDVHLALIGAGGTPEPLPPHVAGPLATSVEYLDTVDYVDALTWMHRADVLLLLAQGQPRQVPAKTFDYLAMGGSILAVTDADGATASIVRDVGGTVVPDEIAPIKAAIAAAYARYRRGDRARLSCPWRRPGIARFDRRHLTRRLVGELNALVAGG